LQAELLGAALGRRPAAGSDGGVAGAPVYLHGCASRHVSSRAANRGASGVLPRQEVYGIDYAAVN